MATGRPAGRPRTPSGKTTPPIEITDEIMDKIPTVPDGIGEDGTVLWYKIWAYCHGWLMDIDRVTILELCQIFDEKELYRRALALGSVPRVYKVPNGALSPHPYVTLLKDSRAQINSLLASLGATPADRAKIGAMESLAEDPLVDMIKRRTERDLERREAQYARQAALEDAEYAKENDE
jgi:P27 family predicted phage terminase small subunit